MLTIARIEDPATFRSPAFAAEVAAVYGSAFSIFRDGPTEQEIHTFATETLPLHSWRDGFRFVAARREDRLIGFIYGYHGRRGEWWEDWIHQRVPESTFDEWFRDQFDITEFCVGAEHHGQGVGSRLYETLLVGLAVLPYQRAVLTTRRLNNPARGFYLRRGWEVVCDALDQRFSLLGLRLD